MLKIDLTGKKAFVAGIGDDQGYGWAIAKALIQAGCTVIAGTWPPVFKIFKMGLEQQKFDTLLPDGSHMQFAKIYPLDAAFDTPQDVPAEILDNKRYKEFQGYTISEVAQALQQDFGTIDILIHSLANAPEVKKPLLHTSRQGYLSALSASSYSFVSLLRHIGPIMQGGHALSLSYLAAQLAVPGYGGGMSSAKAALESDTKLLAWEAGRQWGIRVNAISAGPLASRAAKAIGFIEQMIEYNQKAAPLTSRLEACDIGDTAAFLSSKLAKAITGAIIYVDNGMHAMGVGPDISQHYSSSSI